MADISKISIGGSTYTLVDAYTKSGGSKNVLPLHIDTVKNCNSVDTWSGNTYTNNGVSYVCSVNEAGYITSVSMSGTSGGRSIFVLYESKAGEFVGQYRVSVGMAYNQYCCTEVYVTNGSTTTEMTEWDGDDLIVNVPNSNCTVKIFMYVGSSAGSVNGKVIYPMMRSYDISDDTFEVYFRSNNQLDLNARQTGNALIDNAAKNLLNSHWDPIFPQYSDNPYNTGWELGSLSGAGGKYTDNNAMRTTMFVEVDGGNTYTLSMAAVSPQIWVHYYDAADPEDITHVRREMIGSNTDKVTFTIPKGENITAIKLRVNLPTASTLISYTMLEHGSEATDYEVPYRTQRQIDAELTALRAEVAELRALVLELQGS